MQVALWREEPWENSRLPCLGESNTMTGNRLASPHSKHYITCCTSFLVIFKQVYMWGSMPGWLKNCGKLWIPREKIKKVKSCNKQCKERHFCSNLPIDWNQTKEWSNIFPLSNIRKPIPVWFFMSFFVFAK